MTPVADVVWCDSHRATLVEQATQWMAAGALVLPVIPVEIDAERFPKKRPDKNDHDAHGNAIWKVVVDKEGKNVPKIPGKARVIGTSTATHS